MDRRTVLKGIGVAVAGVGGYKLFLDGPCGPGEDAIGSLEHDSGREVQVKGEVIHKGGDGVVITDGTGTASVGPMYTDPDVGSCVAVRGTVIGCIGETCDDDVYYIGSIESDVLE